jgi:hypothetical protein
MNCAGEVSRALAINSLDTEGNEVGGGVNPAN